MNDTTRRIMGFIFGLISGLVYGLVAQYINALFLPGIPLYHVDPPALNIFLTCLNGALIGLLTAWPEDGIPGILLGSLVGALATTIFSLRNMGGGLEFYSGLFVLLVMTFLPRAFLFLPLAALIRWVLNIWTEEFRSISFSIPKLLLSLSSLLFFAVLVSLFSLHPSFARQSLAQMDQLIQAGMQAQEAEELPDPLKEVDGFVQGASGPYTLELSDNPDLLPVQRPIAPYGVQEYIVFVRFENGFRFGCAFTPTFPDPSCGLY